MYRPSQLGAAQNISTMTTTTRNTREWRLAALPKATPVLDGPDATFRVADRQLPAPSPSQVLLKTLYISNDAAQRVWIAPPEERPRLYLPPVNLNDPMPARVIGRVLQSGSDKVPVGSLAVSTGTWSEHCLVEASKCQVIPAKSPLNPAHFLGLYGITGITAYIGLTEIARVTSSDTVVISAAAGATGSVVVQLAKGLFQCKKVIGIAGTDDKCRWVESLGADLCINYKSAGFLKDLETATGRAATVFFGEPPTSVRLRFIHRKGG